MSAEDAARRAWLAKQDQPITSAAAAKAAWLAKQDVPSWGPEVAKMAVDCNRGVDAACDALSREEEAKLGWLSSTLALTLT